MSCGKDGTAASRWAFMLFQVVSDYPGPDQYVVRQVARCWGMVPAKGAQGPAGGAGRVTIIARHIGKPGRIKTGQCLFNISALHRDVIDSRPALQIFPATDGSGKPISMTNINPW